MKLTLPIHLEINKSLYLRNPEDSELGRNILKNSILLMDEMGFEAFNFKKLALEIGSTEAGVYRYFENKHKLLLYLTAWYWSWLRLQIIFETNNLKSADSKIRKVIKLLASNVQDDNTTHYINEGVLHRIVVAEGYKAYLTKQVDEDNSQHFFEPYEQVCEVISVFIRECNPRYKYAMSLASAVLETAHFQNYFMDHIPAITNFKRKSDQKELIAFLNHMVFSVLK